jgi:hypothetical protein
VGEVRAAVAGGCGRSGRRRPAGAGGQGGGHPEPAEEVLTGARRPRLGGDHGEARWEGGVEV